MLWSAGIDAPDHVWVHGWLLVQGGERMSKSRGNFLDPHAVVAAFGADGARYVTLREVAFDRDTEVSWDSFVRRYNADLANDFGNLVNRTITMVNRYLGGERPAPRPAGESPLAEGWLDTLRLYREKLDGYLLHDALAELWEFVGGANKTVDAEQPWTLAKQAKAGDEAAAERCARSSATSSRRVGSSGRPWHRSCPRWRPASSTSSATAGRSGPMATAAPTCWSSSSGPASRRRAA